MPVMYDESVVEELREDIKSLREEILSLTTFIENEENDHYPCFRKWVEANTLRVAAEHKVKTVTKALRVGIQLIEAGTHHSIVMEVVKDQLLGEEKR